jgi:hypothetical protein
MKIQRIFLLIICFLNMIWSKGSNSTMNTTLTQCNLTAAALDRVNNSPCFSELQTIIACLPGTEQDLWAAANKNNGNSSYCFDCSGNLNNLVRDTMKNNENSLAQLITTQANSERIAVSCLKSFAMKNLSPVSQIQIDSSIQSIVSIQKDAGKCSALLLQNIGNLFISRRRFFCSTNRARSKMYETFSNSIASGFKFTLTEATTVVTNFLDYFNCRNTQMSTIANQVSIMTFQIANDPGCTPSGSTSIQNATISPFDPKYNISASAISPIQNITAIASGINPSGESSKKPD